MPIYEYHCRACQADFEELVLSPSQADHVVCSRCHGSEVERKVSVVGCCSTSGGGGSSSSFGC